MRNLIVVCNNYDDPWIRKLLFSLSSYYHEKLDKQDFLISDRYKGSISKKDNIKEELVKNLKPYAKNIFAFYKSGLTCVIGNEKELYSDYDNILFSPLAIGNALVNEKINELNIKFKRKIIMPTGSDLHNLFILKKVNQEEVSRINAFISDCKNIICPAFFLDYIPVNSDINILNYTLPVDVELYDNLIEENAFKNFGSLDMNLFTKPQLSKETAKVLKIINRKINNFSTLGIFPYLAFKFNDNIFEIIKEWFSKFNFSIVLLKIIKKRKIGIILFVDNRKKDIYYSQLDTFNSLFIQRWGGSTAIKYAVMQGLLLFGDLESPNAKRLTNDISITVLDLDKFDINKYNQKEIEEIITSNRENMVKFIEKSKIFYKNLFYS